MYHYYIYNILTPQIHLNNNNNNNKNNYDTYKLNKVNTAKATYIKHDSPEVKDVVNFADRFWYVLELKNKIRSIIQKSDNHYDADMAMISFR